MKTATIQLALTSATARAAALRAFDADYQKRLRQGRKFAARIDKVLMAYDNHMKASLPQEKLEDIFTTALEWGVDHWSYTSKYNSKKATATILEYLDDDMDDYVKHNINTATILRGLRKMQIETSKGIQECYNRLITDNYDSGDADLCLQFGLFGEERYA